MNGKPPPKLYQAAEYLYNGPPNLTQIAGLPAPADDQLLSNAADGTWNYVAAGPNVTIAGGVISSDAPSGLSKCTYAIATANRAQATLGGLCYTAPWESYLAITGYSNTDELGVAFAVPYAGTARNLTVRTSGMAKVAFPVQTITVRKSGVDTALAVSPTQTINTVTRDTVHSVLFAVTDYLTLSIVTTGVGATACSITSISFEYEASY